MAEELAGQDDVLRTKVLKEINEDFHCADKINLALESSLLAQFMRCFREEDACIRELASRAVLQIGSSEKGRQTLISRKLVPEVQRLFNDSEQQIRHNAYSCQSMWLSSSLALTMSSNSDIIPDLVDKLVLEKDEEILVLILTLMRVLSDGEAAPLILLNTPVLVRLNKHLSSKNKLIRDLSALEPGINIFQHEREGADNRFWFYFSPMPDALRLGIRSAHICHSSSGFPCLVEAGEDPDLRPGDVDRIISLLYDASDQTRLNIVQMIAAIGEYPPAREKFKEALEKLNKMVTEEKEEFPLVSRFAATAIQVITWLP
eukprot:CAMPEP_0202958122 /NCGR_PEP_ID=MMETSP1396-20130829/2467_1 /ASSEMBLY_ACC=CAM_ASM_000872 /TAXON_ID= /ORGANISM="Pseudokeronopsis sp., Strain Brazil" /LENGTH=316 /DNA_ID=CAMNT_0049675989 /DNA_START=114 /DNA_END=1064 /DNA_ORIENTATION=+